MTQKGFFKLLSEYEDYTYYKGNTGRPLKAVTRADLWDYISRPVQAVVMLPYLHNRADGVNGHYCIARDTKEGYSEFWHNDLKIWCSAGTVFELGKVT